MEVTKKIVVIDYGMGNLCSVVNALKFLGCQVIISNLRKEIMNSDAIILPGVGAFKEAMKNLQQLGLIDFLRQQVLEEKKAFLGICLGMQLLAQNSEENGHHQGLAFIEGDVIKIPVKEPLRLPHVGWNDIEVVKTGPLFSKINGDYNFYFSHSYYLNCDEHYVSSYCNYGKRITASIQKDNIFATQFHPEKSQSNGLRVLRGFSDFVNCYSPVKKEAHA